MSTGIVITLGGAFYVIAGKAGAAVSILFSLVILYIAQFNLMQYFGEKFAWYPSFSDGQLVLYFVVSLVLGLLLGAGSKKD